MTLTPLFNPALFRIPDGVAHVCAGGETPFLYSHTEAFEAYARDKSAGSAGRPRQEAKVEHARSLVGALWNVDAASIGFVSSVAEGVSMVMESLAWGEGDNICVIETEYPSVVAPFLLGQGRGRQVRFASPANEAGLASIVDKSTRVIAVSWVSYLNGERLDLVSLRRLADEHDALLIVDFTQASGYLPIDASIADFAFSACYKWMLGMTGVASAYWNRDRQPAWSPATAGWYSIISDQVGFADTLTLRPDAMRFTRGNPAHGAVYVLVNALTYLEGYTASAMQHHVQQLTTDLLGRLRKLEIPSTTPDNPGRHGASVCIASPRAKEIVEHLATQGVYAWNGRGRIRFSFHGFNGAADVDRIETALKVAWQLP
jgi:selenocysteine lyase/cysteine desulfurase